MAGLLGEGWNDPQSNAIMQMAGGLLGGNFAQGASAYGNTMAGARDAAMKRQLVQSQIDENASQNEARKAATAKAANLQSMLQGLFPQGIGAAAVSPGAFAPSIDGRGPTMPPEMAGRSQPGSRLGGLTIDQIAGLKAAGGPDLLESYKWAKDPLKLDQGATYEDRTTGQQRYMPKVGEGVAPDKFGFYSALPGYAEAQAGIEGAKAGAVARATAPTKLREVYNSITGRMELIPESVVLGGQPAQGGAQPGYGSEPAMKSTVAGPMGADPAAIQREIKAVQANLFQQNLDEPSKSLLRAHLADLQKQAQQPGVAPSGNFAAGPSAQEKAQQDARATLSQGVAKTASENLNSSLAGAQSAMGTLQNVEQIRSGLGNAILGPGANARVTLGQLGQVLGVGGANSAEQLVNTRNVIQGLARQELSAAGQMKGQGQITESERSILRKAEAGSINEFSKPEIVTLMGALERSANYRVDQHRQSVEKLRSGADPTSFLDVSQPAAKPTAASKLIDALPTPNSSNKGQRIRDTTTGKILTSNGLQWRAE